MSDEHRLVRTAQAQRELASREAALSARARQILILVDGSRRVADLRRYFPDPGFALEIDTLVAAGFLETAPELTGRSDDDFARCRDQVRDACAARLGEAAGPFVQRIDRTGNRAELRRLVPAILATISALSGAESAAAFEQQVKAL